MQSVHISEIKPVLLRHFFRPASSVRELVKRFVAIQIDPTLIVSTNQSLVIGARSASGFHLEMNQLYRDGLLIETYAKERSLILSEDAPLIWPLLEARKAKKATIFLDYKKEIAHMRAHLREMGQISTGMLNLGSIAGNDVWGSKNCATMLLGLLWETGEIVVTSRDRRAIQYSAAPMALWRPGSLTREDNEMLRLNRWKRYLQGAAITDSRDGFAGFERCPVGQRNMMLHHLVEAGHAVPVCGLGKSFTIVSAELLNDNSPAGEDVLQHFIAPLDNFIWHRELTNDIWNFNYRWEIYTPAAKRKFGAYAMPLVTSQGIHGPVDFRYDRAARTLIGKFADSPIQSEKKTVKDMAKKAANTLGSLIGAEKIVLI